ncbi:MAG: tetratricopeptide repeat protein [Verrucomicrobiota bacterium]
MKAAKQRVKTTNQAASARDVEPGAPGDTTPAPLAVPAARRWVFRGLAVVLSTLVLLGGTELMLRLAGFGYPTAFFLKSQPDGRPVLIENPQFPWRFMPPALARAPQPTVLPAAKPPNTCRIFVLGESAAMGDPEPAQGLPRLLQTLLEDQCPERKFEVVNAAVTAINAHAILPLARECAGLDGDFWVLYMGNNEVMGPFGASTVFGPPTPNLTLLRLGLALKTTRLGQFLEAGAQRLRSRGRAPQFWGGLEMFLDHQIAPGDPRLERVYRHFARNLADILDTAARRGTRVVVSTLVSNLKNSAPFGSMHTPSLTAEQQAEWDRLGQAASRAEAAGQAAEALRLLRQAERIDDQPAELQYRLGRAFWSSGRFDEARKHFERARDLDTLKFRADARLNRIILDTAAGREKEGIHLIDASEAFARQSPQGIVGDELLYEHVHFRFEGNYLLARLFAEQIAQGLRADSSAVTPRPWLSQADCAQRLAVTDWSRYRLLDTLRQNLNRPPFATQLNFRERDQRLLQQMRELQPATQRTALEAQTQIYRQALARQPNDWVLHDQFGKFLEAFGDADGAAREWRKVIALVPHHLPARYQLGVVLNRGEANAEAESHLREAVRLRPDFAEAINELGWALARQRKFAEACEQFAQALKLRSDFAGAHVNWGLALVAEGKPADALAHYQAALTINSNNLPAHAHLARLLVQHGQTAQAAGHFGEVLRIDPRNRAARQFFETNQPRREGSP